MLSHLVNLHQATTATGDYQPQWCKFVSTISLSSSNLQVCNLRHYQLQQKSFIVLNEKVTNLPRNRLSLEATAHRCSALRTRPSSLSQVRSRPRLRRAAARMRKNRRSKCRRCQREKRSSLTCLRCRTSARLEPLSSA